MQHPGVDVPGAHAWGGGDRGEVCVRLERDDVLVGDRVRGGGRGDRELRCGWLGRRGGGQRYSDGDGGGHSAGRDHEASAHVRSFVQG